MEPMFPRDVADQLVQALGWRGEAKVRGGALQTQALIEHRAAGIWLGVDYDRSIVQIVGGHINSDGTVALPQDGAQSSRMVLPRESRHLTPAVAQAAREVYDRVAQVSSREAGRKPSPGRGTGS